MKPITSSSADPILNCSRTGAGIAPNRELKSEQGKDDCFTPSDEREWTFLVYSSITADIKNEGAGAFHELEKAGTDKNMAIVMERAIPADKDNPLTVQRFLVKKPSLAGESSSLVLQEMGPRDMSEPENLKNFIEWGMKAFSAKKYAVAVGGHSAGFVGAVTDGKKQKMMDIPDMALALKEAKDRAGARIDLLIFNSCLMGQIEVAPEFSGVTPVLVASQKPEYGLGIPLGPAVEEIKKRVQKGCVPDGREAAEIIVEEAEKTPDRIPSLGAVDTEKTLLAVEALDRLAERLLYGNTPIGIIKELVEKAAPSLTGKNESPPFTDCRDLRSFADALAGSDKINDGEIKKAASELIECLDGAVIKKTEASFEDLPQKEKENLKEEGISSDNYTGGYNGFSAYMPLKPLSHWGAYVENTISEKYGALKFSKNSLWSRFIRELQSKDLS